MIASVEVLQAKKAVTDAEREVMAAEKDIQLAQTALYGVIGYYRATAHCPHHRTF